MSTSSSQRYHPAFLKTPEIIIYFICRIDSSYPNERIEFVHNFCDRFIERIDEYIQNKDNNKNTDDSNDNEDYIFEKEKHGFYTDDDVYDAIKTAPFHPLLCLFSPYIIHNRFMCPIHDVSNAFAKLIQYINTKLNMTIPQSLAPYPLSGFLELKGIKLPYQKSKDSNKADISMTNGSSSATESIHDNDTQLSLHEKLYSMFGRITHFSLLLESHQNYLDDFVALMHSLMFENNGPLGQEKRQYLGLMAASRYDCKPIIEQCELQYRKFNGDMTWIKSGITSAPQKYQKLAKINAILAHQPWLISAQHINDLVNCDSAWSISECVQSFVILIIYHFICGMYQGLCITPEIDNHYSSELHLLHQQMMNNNQQKQQQKEDKQKILTNLEHVLSPITMTEPQQQIDEIEHSVFELQLNNDSEKQQIDNNTMHETDNHEMKVYQLDNEEENQRCQDIARLLSHRQQQLVVDENVVGAAKKGFEESACLNLDLDSVSERKLPDAANRSCFITFRQISDSADDSNNDHQENDDSLSMEFDPNMAPPSLSNNSDPRNISTSNDTIDEEKKPSSSDETAMHHKLVDTLDYASSIPTKQENELTSSYWKQLISLRKQNMFATNSISSEPQKNTTDNTYYTNDQKLVKILNPSKNDNGKTVNTTNDAKNGKNGKKSRKYRKIKAPTSQGTLYWKYSLGINMSYTDFDCHSSYHLHLYDFNWDKHGYACLSRYYPGIEKKMDAVFKTAFTMTDYSINGKDNLNTEPFRKAVQHYTFRLYGVNNDAYEYRFVNIYLPIKLKVFIKKLVCYPGIVTIDDVKKMGVALKEKEKIHIAILALTAKKQAALLFALKAIMKYMQTN